MMMETTRPNSLIRSVGIDALPTVPARLLQALLNVFGAGQSLEARRAIALEFTTGQRDARPSMPARRGRAQVLLLTVFPRISLGARALILVQGLQQAIATVVARR